MDANRVCIKNRLWRLPIGGLCESHSFVFRCIRMYADTVWIIGWVFLYAKPPLKP